MLSLPQPFHAVQLPFERRDAFASGLEMQVIRGGGAAARTVVVEGEMRTEFLGQTQEIIERIRDALRLVLGAYDGQMPLE